jgi:hypothetical protein
MRSERRSPSRILDPLTTAELFDVLAELLSKKRSAVTPPAALIENSLMIPFSPP